MAGDDGKVSAVRSSVSLSSTGVFLVSLVIQLLGYIPTHFLAFHVGGYEAPNQTYPGQVILGTVQWFLLLASSINMIGDLRIGSAYVFFVARGESPKVATGTYLVLRVAMVAVAGVVLWLAAPELPYSTGQYLEIFGLWMTLPFLWSISTVYSQLMVAQGRSTRGQVPLLIESIIRTSALTAVALHSLTLPPSSFAEIIPQMTYAYLLGAGVSALFSVPAVFRETTRFRSPSARRLFRFAWPLMGSLILLYLTSVLIQFLVVVNYSAQVYTIFLAANGFRILALSIPAAVAVPLFPHLSGLHKRGDFDLVRQRAWAALRYTALVIVPLAMAMIVYRVNLLNILYVRAYTVGATALAILAVSAVPAALSQIIGNILNSVGRQRLELYLTSLQVGVLVVASLVFMWPFKLFGFDGLVAASTAVLLSSTAALVLNTYFLERLVAVRIQLRPVLTIVLAAIVSFGAVATFNTVFLHIQSTHNIYQLAGGVLLGFAVYGLVLVAVGELAKADARQIAGALGLPRPVGEALARICWREESWPVNPIPPEGAEALQPLDEEQVAALATGTSPPSRPP